MGTNYYAHFDLCGECNRSDELHIGKFSGGWPFTIHAIPDKDLNTWDDWLQVLKAAIIKDEYGELILLSELAEIVTEARQFARACHVTKLLAEDNIHQTTPDGDLVLTGEFF